jgi:hypothetical protein
VRIVPAQEESVTLITKTQVNRDNEDWDMAAQALNRKVGSLNDSLIA